MNYPTNITDSQRAFIVENCKEILTTKSKIDVIEVLSAIFYLVKTGRQWRMLPLGLAITTANVHDSKAAFRLTGSLGDKLQLLSAIKGEMGYRGKLATVLESCIGIELRCVKSNWGTSEFRPIDGRWVVERTFAWLDTFRRLCRNYEHYLHTARGMTIVAFVMLLLRKV